MILPTEPASCTAIVADHEVHMVAGIRCPACEQCLQPYDFDIGNEGQLILLICRTCHRDVLRIEELPL